jgi:tetratricopeptide (TPR) repeat protein
LSGIAAAIEDAGSELGWDMKSISPWHIVGTISIKRKVAVVDIKFDHESYGVFHKESSHLGYNGSSIHRVYNKWIQDLDRVIKRKLLTANCTNAADFWRHSVDIPTGELRNAKECYDRGLAEYDKSHFDQAIAGYTKAIEIYPQFANAYYNRGIAWAVKGYFDQAIADYTKAIEIDTRCVNAYNNLSWLLVTCQDERYLDSARAVELAQKAAALDPKADILDTLAASYAEAGKFGDAIRIQKNAIILVKEEGRTEKLGEYNERLKLYQAYKPWRKKVDKVISKGTEVKAETVTPRQTSKKKAARTKQVTQATQPSSVKEPEVKVAAVMPQQASKEKAAPAKQPAQPTKPSSVKEPEVKVAAVMPQQMNKVKIIPAKKTIYPYTIQVSSYLYREKSNSIAIELRKKGDPAFTSPAYVAVEGDWYRVFIGYYGTLVETVKAASKLKERKFIYSRVVKRPYAIQVGLFDSDQELGKMGANLRSKEYVAYSIPDRTYSDKTRLLIGAFETEEEAARLTKKLQQEGFKPTVVKR